ncbi:MULTISPECIES: winged helix-turn-helix domain-containing protein [Streptosporangium]|uniref:DNA-binding transcriptional ArsR family regulator n=1 Tax=Streptosporangium brasiliense TaxID=47480 RepID=A0ABT9RKD0_9ACTN|nr:helix-turn-helix domain-containing protein [Streptosporangium brasiliense]MDP9869744.1 DNA-binding transcriptional ArsR family regulator [Streptosporangium brasiliense]
MKITDPRAMRALAHPLRLDLMDLLGRIGPATAAVCARRLGTTQASCSFHLRQLAKYGYVVEAESEDQRERPWRVADMEQSWSSSTGGVAAAELERVFVEREATRLLDWTQARPHTPEEWRAAAFLNGVTAPMTAQELDGLGEQLAAVLAPYIERATGRAAVPQDARYVRILLSGTPLPDSPPVPD